MSALPVLVALLLAATSPPEGGWKTLEDYPEPARSEGRHGTAMVAFDVTETGRVDNCRTLRSSGTPALDEASCRIIVRRAIYTISKDAQGQPKRIAMSIGVHWLVHGMRIAPNDLPIGREDVVITGAPPSFDTQPSRVSGGERKPFKLPAYPSAARKEGRGGPIALLLIVDKRGRVRDCTVARSTGSADLDAATCAFARDKLRYTPARTADGKPVEVQDYLRLAWEPPVW